MMATDASLWQRLADAGIVSGDVPPARTEDGPWYIAAIVGAAAWLAALFILMFLGMALQDVVKAPAGAIAIGLMVSGIAIAILLRWGDALFVGQLAFAFSLAGQALVLLGLLMPGSAGTTAGCWLFAAFEAALVVFVAHTGHRVMSTLAAAVATLVALASLSLAVWFLPLVLAGFVAVEANLLAGSRHHALWRAVALGLALALLAGMAYSALPDLWNERRSPASTSEVLRWMPRVVLAGIAAFAATVLVHDAGGKVVSRHGAIAALALGGVTVAAWSVPAAAVAIGVRYVTVGALPIRSPRMLRI